MNKEVSDILQSDLLERYVLGDATAQEEAKIWSLSQTSPEIRKALDELEKSMERSALENKVDVPFTLKEKIVNKDYTSETGGSSQGYFTTWLRYAACFALGVACAWLVQNQRISKLEQEKLAISGQMATLKTDYRKVNQQIAFINDNSTLQAVLKGTTFAPSSKVVVFWNEKNKECLLRVSNLPDIPSDKTYQLWADVDGEMRSLGIFDLQAAKAGLVKMAYLDNAKSLNISVEKTGGSDVPTLSTLSASIAI